MATERIGLAGIDVEAGGVARCWWCAADPLHEDYRDRECGRPVADDRRLFEKLCLEGFQAGLGGLTILRKRENFRAAFAGFDVERVAQFESPQVEQLLTDTGIVRHRAKIEATVNKARRCIALGDEFSSLAAYVWRFEPDLAGRPRVLDRAALMQL